MSLRDGPLGDIKPPVRWMALIALIIAGLGGVALLFGDRRGEFSSGVEGTVQRSAETVIRPVAAVFAVPASWLSHGTQAIGDYFGAAAQNSNLRLQLAQARQWKDEAVALRDENARYRAMLSVRTNPPIPLVLARTILDARGPFARTRLADAGSLRGVIEGNPVLSEHGLLGRVVGVTGRVSRIMLLSDIESRTPVLIARTNGRAILTGDGGPNPALGYLRSSQPIREGDRIVSSGDGGVVPRGLPVGSVVKGYDGEWRVALDSDAAPIDFVQIMLFKDFSQLVGPHDLLPGQLPPTTTEAPVPAQALSTGHALPAVKP